MKGRASWTRSDSLVVLASYVERPRDAMVPPRAERERVANLLGQTVEAVTQRLWMFAELDPDNRAEGDDAGERERRLWERYTDDRVALMIDADDVAAERRRVPRQLRR